MKDEEREALLAAAEQLARFATLLRAQHLTVANPEIDVWEHSHEAYTSEIRVKIYRNGILDDALEFHVFRDGRLLVSREDVARWFEQQLRALVA